MTTCKPCSLRAQGQTRAAANIDGTRAQRLILAALNNNRLPRTNEILAEVDNCSECVVQLASQLVGLGSQTALLAKGGNVEALKDSLKVNLMEEVRAFN